MDTVFGVEYEGGGKSPMPLYVSVGKQHIIAQDDACVVVLKACFEPKMFHK